MNTKKIKQWNCKKCGIGLGDIITDYDGDRLIMDEKGGKIKTELRIEKGTFKRWCSNCNTINILRPIICVKLIALD